MIDIVRDIKKAFEDGELSMFEQITSAYYGKQFYFVEPDGSIYSRLSSKTFEIREEAYREFINEICRT